MLSRMNGNTHTIKNLDELSPQIRAYANEYRINKIKTALQKSWGLKYYSRYTRGFYFSFKLAIDILVLEAEKRRKNTWEKQNKHETSEAQKKAIFQLFNNPRHGKDERQGTAGKKELS